jgi:F-type H+-transporting ATPase subunit delta
MKITAKQYATALLESLEGKSEDQSVKIIDSFSRVLLSNNHLSRLNGIVGFFNEAWDKKHGEIEGEIITARALSQEAISELKEFIRETTGGRKINLMEKIDESLLGGAVLRYGNKSLDLSLKTKLLELKRQIID